MGGDGGTIDFPSGRSANLRCLAGSLRIAMHANTTFWPP